MPLDVDQGPGRQGLGLGGRELRFLRAREDARGDARGDAAKASNLEGQKRWAREGDGIGGELLQSTKKV